jgi:hypothetical protein
VAEGLPVFPFVEAGSEVTPEFAVGEPAGEGLGVTFGVPLRVGVGNGTAGPRAEIVAVGWTTGVFAGRAGVAVGTVVLVGVGIGVGVGGFGVGVGCTGGVGVFVGVGVGVFVGVGVSVGVIILTGDDVAPGIVGGNVIAMPVACEAGCNATIPMIENNSNAELIARARKTQYAILVDFLNPFMKPRLWILLLREYLQSAPKAPKLCSV